MQISELLNYTNSLLNTNAFTDYSPNGLQVSGKSAIKKIITGVTACQALIDEAVKRDADVVLVHHGYFWKGEDPCVTGIMRQRLSTLLQHNINLIAYHLPLDAHPKYGNNAQLGRVLDLNVTDILNDGLLYVGELAQAQDVHELSQQFNKKLNRQPQIIDARKAPIKTLAWCTGAAQDLLVSVAELGIDAFISGEISERTFHIANEYNIDYICAGHHATEMFGIKVLGEHLAEKFNLNVEFVDIVNPI